MFATSAFEARRLSSEEAVGPDARECGSCGFSKTGADELLPREHRRLLIGARKTSGAFRLAEAN